VIASLAGASVAVSTATLSALMQTAPFAFQNSNRNDSDLRRQFPTFANPARQSQERPPMAPEEELQGEELIPLSVRMRQAAIKDPVLGLRPELYQPWEGATFYVPVDHAQKKFLSPVFIVDPEFNGDTPEEYGHLFIDNDHGGWKKPLIQSTFPIISKQAQEFFHVSGDCTCMNHEIVFKTPKVVQMPFPDHIKPAYEPQYDNASYVMPRERWHTMYRGDDYGGHNIPFPHPRPPTPAPEYEHAWVDVGKIYGLETPMGAHFGGVWDYAFNGLRKIIENDLDSYNNGAWGQEAPHDNEYAGWGQEAPHNNEYAGWGQEAPKDNEYAGWGQEAPKDNEYAEWGQEAPKDNEYAEWGQEAPKDNEYAEWGQEAPKDDGYAGWGQDAWGKDGASDVSIEGVKQLSGGHGGLNGFDGLNGTGQSLRGFGGLNGTGKKLGGFAGLNGTGQSSYGLNGTGQ